MHMHMLVYVYMHMYVYVLCMCNENLFITIPWTNACKETNWKKFGRSDDDVDVATT